MMNAQYPDEVSSAKRYLNQHYAVKSAFDNRTALREGADLTLGAAEAGIEREDLHYGMGLDFANWLVNKRRESRYQKSKNRLPKIVAEGDSWFLHPLVSDIIDNLSDTYAVKCLAAAGDEFIQMIEAQDSISSALIEEDSSILLLSGGGNDLLGDRFVNWLRERPSDGAFTPTDILNEDYSQMLNKVLTEYGNLFDHLFTKHNKLRVITHGYDYVIPRYGKEGKWLGSALEVRGFDSRYENERRGIVREVVNQFNQRLKLLADDFNSRNGGKERVLVVSGLNVVQSWYDEIHPDAENAGKIAELFHEKLRSLL
ncbi:MAG: hypothetical protein IPK32_00340 [Verrucomicrobiaceae bacterium]|nr:hypothetical protein [Verrucomicrobiaceae bacterium]